MKLILSVLTLALTLTTTAHAEQPKGNLHCRSVGINAWVGAIFAPSAMLAAGACRDDRTGAYYALVQTQAGISIGAGAGANITMARSRLHVEDPSTFATVVWHDEGDRSMKGGGVVLGVSMGGCYESFYSNTCEVEDANGDRGVGLGLGDYGSGDGGNAYVLVRLTSGTRFVSRTDIPNTASQPRATASVAVTEEQEGAGDAPASANAL